MIDVNNEISNCGGSERLRPPFARCGSSVLNTSSNDTMIYYFYMPPSSPQILTPTFSSLPFSSPPHLYIIRNTSQHPSTRTRNRPRIATPPSLSECSATCAVAGIICVAGALRKWGTTVSSRGILELMYLRADRSDVRISAPYLHYK